VTAAEALTRRLVDLRGIVVNGRQCQSSSRDRWTSESAEDRGWAATVCSTLGCASSPSAPPPLTRATISGTWGGLDRTPAPQHQKVPATNREESDLAVERVEVERESRGGRGGHIAGPHRRGPLSGE
jgi:hypothetical protein